MAKLALDGGKPVRARKDFLVFGAPQIGKEEIAGVTDSLRRRWIGTGPKVGAFEQAFAAYKTNGKAPAPYAVAVNSCTAALHLSILSLGIGPGDEVITTPLTFCATANAILHAGAKPPFCTFMRPCAEFTASSGFMNPPTANVACAAFRCWGIAAPTMKAFSMASACFSGTRA